MILWNLSAENLPLAAMRPMLSYWYRSEMGNTTLTILWQRAQRLKRDYFLPSFPAVHLVLDIYDLFVQSPCHSNELSRRPGNLSKGSPHCSLPIPSLFARSSPSAGITSMVVEWGGDKYFLKNWSWCFPTPPCMVWHGKSLSLIDNSVIMGNWAGFCFF